ncbi:MAG: 3-hydroxyacyl-ACP dehydratase FabZ family protein [Planctomycetota bacterium]
MNGGRDDDNCDHDFLSLQPSIHRAGNDMTFHQYEFADVTKYLHHRPPYLLVDRVMSCGDLEVVTEKRVTGEEFFLPGHFPGAPILPGAMMQEMTTQSAGILIAARYNPMSEFDTSDPHFNRYALGVLVRIHQARYYTFARPGDVLTCTVTLQERLEQLFDFRAAITINGRAIMRNAFQLTNIESSVLTGDRP